MMRRDRSRVNPLVLACLGIVAVVASGCPTGSDCPEGQVMCGNACVTLDSDGMHCGGCDRQCDPGNVCSSGQCAVSCQGHLSNCGGMCVDIQNDHANCGNCGRLCDSGNVCSDGQCAVSCQGHLSNCAGMCVDLENDHANCGGCGRLCDSGNVCSYGQCAVSCQGHLSICGGLCVDYEADRLNCGACGRECPEGQICASGYCTPTCAAPLVRCGDICADTSNDPAHCGTCDKACNPDQVCAGSAGCQDLGCIQECPEGQKLCNGQCTDIAGDAFHCGDCGNVCAVDEACVAGVCSAGAFRILSMDTQCWIVDDTAKLDAPNGPIAFGTGMLYYSGSALVLGYDFVGNYAVQRSQEAIPTLTSDLASGDLWALGGVQGWATSAGSTITHLVPVVAGNYLEPGTAIPLSESFDLPGGSGLFAGLGRIGVHTGTELVLLDTATGQVTRLASPALDAAACVGPFYSGLLEQHADGLRLTYVQAGTNAVVRSRPGDGGTQVVLQGEDFADMCGLAVDLFNSKWCFHLAQPSTQFDTQPGQSAAFCCDAGFAVEESGANPQ